MTCSITCSPRAFAAASALALACTSSAALAQSTAQDMVTAEALFRSGRELVSAGDYEAGCPKFEAALELVPSAATMLNIATCHEHEGRLASAWASYQRALTLNQETAGEERKQGLADLAHKGIAAVEPRLPRLRVTVDTPPPGLVVLRDEQALPLATLGEALPLDPGVHTLSVSATGFVTATREVTLKEGETTSEAFTLVALPTAAPSPAPAPPLSPSPPPSDEAEAGPQTWVWVTGGAGLVLVGASVVFLVDDLDAISALREGCNVGETSTTCTEGYDYASDNARKNRSFGLFVGLGGAGAIALGAALYGLATASSEPEVAASRRTVATPWVGPSGAGATVSGAF